MWGKQEWGAKYLRSILIVCKVLKELRQTLSETIGRGQAEAPFISYQILNNSFLSFISPLGTHITQSPQQTYIIFVFQQSFLENHPPSFHVAKTILFCTKHSSFNLFPESSPKFPSINLSSLTIFFNPSFWVREEFSLLIRNSSANLHKFSLYCVHSSHFVYVSHL